MSFENELITIFEKYGFILTQKQVEQFKNYYRLLILWNKQFNLTAIVNQTDVIIKHFLDSVLSINELEKDCSVIDIGTGAGFPGIPIKIMRDDIYLCLVDSLKKRTVFLREVVETLQLENVLIIHDRAETLAHSPKHRENYNYAVSRAVAKLNTLLEYCSAFVVKGGKVITYKAKNVEEELAEASNAMKVLNLTHEKTLNYNIQEIQAKRNIVIFNKTNNTSMLYPRQQNKAKSQPL